MGHTPFGYRIENGKAVIDKTAAEQIKALYESYLSGDALATAAQKSGIQAFHSGITRILQNARYLGDEYYPAIIGPDTFAAAEEERIKRAEKLGRVREPIEPQKAIYHTSFRLREGTKKLDDPFQQAEYAYSLIETEVYDNECE